MRAETTTEARTGTYKLTVKTKQAKANKTIVGEGTVTTIPFEAVPGAVVKGTLKAENLSTSSIVLVGPQGLNPYEFAGKGSKVKVVPTLLERGLGTYEIRFAAASTVAWKLKVKPPRKVKGSL